MDFFCLQSLLLILLSIPALIFLSLQFKEKPKSKTGLRSYPFLGNLPDYAKNRHRLLEWMTQLLANQPTNTITLQRPGSKGVITANPANVEYMLKTKFENYPKGQRFISRLEDFLGHGIFNSDGDLWKVQRKTASYEFNTKSLRNFVLDSVRGEIEDRLLPLLEKTSKNSETIDLQDVLERFAFDNVCKVSFNEDPKCLGDGDDGRGELSPQFAQAFEVGANLSAGRFRYLLPFLWRIKKFLNVGTEKQLKESTSTVHGFATKIIQSRMKNGSHANDDLLSRFIANKDNSEEFIRDIVVSFILAGRDTTSSSLAWFFWLISSRPHVVQKILNELRSIRSQSQNTSTTFSFDELREMHYLHAAISEALRLYPPVAVDTKECLEDDILPDGTFVGKGWFMTYHAYAMGRMENIWGKDCHDFKPERWLENGVFRPESPFRFPVFHAGVRMCLGKEMAYIQMKSIAACVIERFEINVLEKEKCPEHMLSLTFRMKRGLPTQATPKSNTLSNKNMTAHIESMQDQGMNVPAAKARKSSLTSSIDWLDVLCKVSNQKPAFSYPNIMGSVRPLGCLWIHTNQPRNSMQESLEPAKTTKSVVAVDDTGKAKIKRKKLKGKRAIVRWLKFFRYKKKKEYERMTAEEKILYKLKKAQRKEERLAQALQKIEPPDSSETTHDPEILTPEEHFYYLKMGHKCKNYVPIGRRGIFQGVILNMHLHWKKHQTLKVMVKTFTPEEVRQIAVELARLSGGIVLDIHEENTIIMYRGKNYCQPPTEIMSPKITLSKKKALDKSKYRDGLRAVRNLIPRLERDLEVLQVQMNQERDNKVNAASEKCPANIDSNNHEEIPGHHLDHLDGFAEIMSGNENLSEDDSFSSGALSDSEALSDIFETDSDEDEEEKAEPALYLDEFEKFPVDHKEEPEDFEEHLRQISINAKKSGSSEKDAKLPDLDEVDRIFFRAGSLLRKKRK